jgi:2-amino-4-hydroxy-6-hydroxymethyldihydropteridine diphosphokinase
VRDAAALPDPEPPETVYLGLGSNVEPRLDHLRRAVFALATHPEIELDAVSAVFETEYVGPGRQAPYLNACARLRTTLLPLVLLAVLKGTEERQGRAPGSHMRPRPIDLDILVYGDRICRGTRLTLPHPGLRQRGFVLEPLRDIAPDLVLPDSRETVADACARIRAQAGPWVRAWRGSSLGPRTGTGGEVGWRAAVALHHR